MRYQSGPHRPTQSREHSSAAATRALRIDAPPIDRVFVQTPDGSSPIDIGCSRGWTRVDASQWSLQGAEYQSRRRVSRRSRLEQMLPHLRGSCPGQCTPTGRPTLFPSSPPRGVVDERAVQGIPSQSSFLATAQRRGTRISQAVWENRHPGLNWERGAILQMAGLTVNPTLVTKNAICQVYSRLTQPCDAIVYVI